MVYEQPMGIARRMLTLSVGIHPQRSLQSERVYRPALNTSALLGHRINLHPHLAAGEGRFEAFDGLVDGLEFVDQRI